MNPELTIVQEPIEQNRSIFRNNVVPYLMAMRQNSNMIAIEAVPDDIPEFRGKQVTIRISDGFNKLGKFAGKCDMAIDNVQYLITSDVVGEGDITTILGEPIEPGEKVELWSLVYKIFDRVEPLPARKLPFRDLGRTSLTQLNLN